MHPAIAERVATARMVWHPNATAMVQSNVTEEAWQHWQLPGHSSATLAPLTALPNAADVTYARWLLAMELAGWLSLVLARERWTFAASALVAAVPAVINEFEDRIWFEQPFAVHYFFGIALGIAARATLDGDGRPVTIHWLQALTLTSLSAFIFYMDATHHTYLAHLILDSSGVFLGLMSLLQSLLQRISTPARVALMQRVRTVCEPCCLAAVGFVFLKHIHSEAVLSDSYAAGKASITNLYHSSIAWSMIVCALAHLCSSFVHGAASDRTSETCQLMRAVAAYATLYPALVLVHMAVVLHTRVRFDGNNLHRHWEEVILFRADEEAMCLYLACIVLINALVTSLLIATTPHTSTYERRVASRSVGAALEEAEANQRLLESIPAKNKDLDVETIDF